MNLKTFKAELQAAATEEAVKATYAAYFGIKYNTSHHHDLYTRQVIFEFKSDKDFTRPKALASILSQSLYYIRRLKYHDVEKIIPHYICIADKDEAVITETATWIQFFTNEKYEWDRAASKPDPQLIADLVLNDQFRRIRVYSVTKSQDHDAFSEALKQALDPQRLLDFGDKKVITEENFAAVFEHWKDVIGRYIINGYKPSFYFLANIQRDKVTIDRENNQVAFTFEDRRSKTQKVLMKDYERFWTGYDYVENTDTIQGIHSKLDRLTDESQRRLEGEFYTPLPFARKAIHYLSNVLGKNWYKTGRYRLWDMAAGTGNLEYDLPAAAYK